MLNSKLRSVLLASVVFASCASAADEFKVLTDYVASQNLDANKVMERKTWIPGADGLVENLSDYFIVDIREDDVAPKNGVPDFEDGHIAGAKNTTFKNILKFVKANKAKDNILVVCEDGQASAAAATALRMSGYPNTKVIKFGMAGWNKKFDNWTDKLSSSATKNPNWTKDAPLAPEKFNETPKLKTGKKTGKDILAARVDEFLAKGYQTINANEVLENIDKLYVVNQGNAKEYKGLGNVKGARQFDEPLLKKTEKNKTNGELNNYPTNKPIVQYCWTGHAAITVASWMSILGYDAKGVAYGTNAMIYDSMKSSKFTKPMGYSFVTGK